MKSLGQPRGFVRANDGESPGVYAGIARLTRPTVGREGVRARTRPRTRGHESPIQHDDVPQPSCVPGGTRAHSNCGSPFSTQLIRTVQLLTVFRNRPVCFKHFPRGYDHRLERDAKQDLHLLDKRARERGKVVGGKVRAYTSHKRSDKATTTHTMNDHVKRVF